jgi:hypothetical protein
MAKPLFPLEQFPRSAFSSLHIPITSPFYPRIPEILKDRTVTFQRWRRFSSIEADRSKQSFHK